MLALIKKTLRCSFCGKTEKEVARLLGGAGGVHICDGCVGACNKILEATPATFAGWDTMTDAQLLGGLKTAEATVEATRAVLQAMIEELRRRGVSWEAIGKALGVSRQAAWERFS
jgi:ATP-dependent protease Clp ATPase subunit